MPWFLILTESFSTLVACKFNLFLITACHGAQIKEYSAVSVFIFFNLVVAMFFCCLFWFGFVLHSGSTENQKRFLYLHNCTLIGCTLMKFLFRCILSTAILFDCHLPGFENTCFKPQHRQFALGPW